jgi:hypothetical protein
MPITRDSSIPPILRKSQALLCAVIALSLASVASPEGIVIDVRCSFGEQFFFDREKWKPEINGIGFAPEKFEYSCDISSAFIGIFTCIDISPKYSLCQRTRSATYSTPTLNYCYRETYALAPVR